MSVREIILLGFTILGGLAIFLFGMKIMTDGLRVAAGDRLRILIHRGTRNRMNGLLLGSSLGFLIHSSATTVMAVGFIHAGLLSLAQSLPVFMGANFGTTLSMQLIAFKLTDYAFVAVAVGFFSTLASPLEWVRHAGRGLLGFGLLFVGMDLMSGSIQPHREALLPWLAVLDGSTWVGLLTGTLAAWLFTAIIQSSGATIGMTFVLISAGVFTSIEQVYPIILGAHLGTTTTAILASLGGGSAARRGALANFVFNMFNVLVAMLAMPLFTAGMEWIGGDLVRQAANLHTAIMAVAIVLLIPFTPALARMLMAISPSKQASAQASYLDPELLPRPESALVAVTCELRRSLQIIRSSLAELKNFVAAPQSSRASRLIAVNETALDEICHAVRSFLARLTKRYLSRRQRLMVQYLTHIAVDLERMGDHIENMVETTRQQHRQAAALYDASMIDSLGSLFASADAVIGICLASLDPQGSRYPEDAEATLAAAEAFSGLSKTVQDAVNQRVAAHQVSAIAGLFFSDHTLQLDRIMRHAKMIAREQQQAYFSFKASKLDRIEPPAELKLHPSVGKAATAGKMENPQRP